MKTVAASMQHMVDNKSKGNQLDSTSCAHESISRLYCFLSALIAAFPVSSFCTYAGSPLYKADNTQLGGTAAQRAVAAFRDIDIKAALELTYPVTQAILQTKHDPKDAKIKDEIVRFWGMDCWNG